MSSTSCSTASSTVRVHIVQQTLSLLWDWLACFRSVALAIVLLSSLALATLVGVLMPQENLVEPTQIREQFGQHYHTLKAMGLFNVYSAYWFLALQVLFFFNLLFGSFQWLKPAFESATRASFLSATQLAKATNASAVTSPLTPEVLDSCLRKLLKKHRYQVLSQPGNSQAESKEQCLYATKDAWSRLGPCVAHFGILSLLLALLFGTFFGFKAQHLAVPGETFSLNATERFFPNIDPSVWQGHIPDWQVRVNDFRMELYEDHPETVKQYYADLDILNAQGDVLNSKTISVNHPIQREDITIYQASFVPTGNLFLSINGKPQTLSVNSDFQGKEVSFYPLDEKPDGPALIVFPFIAGHTPGATETHVRVFLKTKDGFLGASGGDSDEQGTKMPENLRLNEDQSGMLSDYHIQFHRPEIATGLQIKKAPEVPWVYASYLMIAIGAVMCFFSQRKLWIVVHNNENTDMRMVRFLPWTNKAKLSFAKELQQLQSEIAAVLQAIPERPATQKDIAPVDPYTPDNSKGAC